MSDYARHLVVAYDLSNINPLNLAPFTAGICDGTGVGLVAATDIVEGVAGGKAIEFDGAAERIVVTACPFYLSNTYSFWMKGGRTGVLETVLAHWDNPIIRIDFNVVDGITVSDGTGWTLTSNTVLDINRWYHIVVTMNQNGGNRTTSIYVNRVFDISMTHPWATVDLDGQLDLANYAGVLFFQGIIDSVRIYSVALTPLQVSDLYERTRKGILR